MEIKPVSREQFVQFITAGRADAFARTFIAKCNMLKAWDSAMGCWDGEELMGAIVITFSKRPPLAVNLQLLHTFAKHRNRGVGTELCKWAVQCSSACGAFYFRVSAEPEALGFYQKLGFKFWGKQKSGCSLSLFRINGHNITDGLYDLDEFTMRKLNKKGKGGLVERYEKAM